MRVTLNYFPGNNFPSKKNHTYTNRFSTEKTKKLKKLTMKIIINQQFYHAK